LIVAKSNFSEETAAVNDSWMGDSLNNNLLVVNSSMGTVPIWGSSVVTEEGIASCRRYQLSVVPELMTG
jgi:hypothetical protein